MRCARCGAEGICGGARLLILQGVRPALLAPHCAVPRERALRLYRETHGTAPPPGRARFSLKELARDLRARTVLSVFLTALERLELDRMSHGEALHGPTMIAQAWGVTRVLCDVDRAGVTAEQALLAVAAREAGDLQLAWCDRCATRQIVVTTFETDVPCIRCGREMLTCCDM